MSKKGNISDDQLLRESGFYASDEEIVAAMNREDITEKATSAQDRVFDSISARLGFEEECIKKPLFRNRYWWSVAASVLVVSGLGFLFYQFGGRSDMQVAELLEAHNPSGTILELMLPDSTKVILNSGSSLRYPSFFAGGQRNVELNGEAFFDVAKDAGNPFIIQTHGMEVKVLGTRFNLKSFADEHSIQLTLEEGAVKAWSGMGEQQQEHILIPGDQITMNKATGEVTSRKVNVAWYKAWINGEIIFNDHTLEEITRELEKKFNVEIVIQNQQIKQRKYYCQFGPEDDLEYILGLLSYGRNWTYTKEGNQIHIIQ